MSKYEKTIKDYFKKNPKASLGEIANEIGCSKSTVAKYKPQELKAKLLTEEEILAKLEKKDRAQAALEKLPWDIIKQVRNANGYKLYPINWERIESYYAKKNEEIPFNFHSAEEFEELLKEVCDNLYDWHLYEPCPICGEGILVPRWNAGTNQWTPFCGCSNFPICDFSMDRCGEQIC